MTSRPSAVIKRQEARLRAVLDRLLPPLHYQAGIGYARGGVACCLHPSLHRFVCTRPKGHEGDHEAEDGHPRRQWKDEFSEETTNDFVPVRVGGVDYTVDSKH